ncbi:hypothetical protein B0H13DRAFT_1550229, partial [Mycena leptocephala]
LTDLKKKQKDIRNQLNGILDPMTRLPLEISSNIFVRCLPDRLDRCVASPDVAPMLLLDVCRSWRKIALSTPSLW